MSDNVILDNVKIGYDTYRKGDGSHSIYAWAYPANGNPDVPTVDPIATTAGDYPWDGLSPTPQGVWVELYELLDRTFRLRGRTAITKDGFRLTPTGPL